MANSTHTTTLSRRRALAGLASAAAVIPAGAIAAATDGHPDAALLDLGKTLAQRINEYRAAMDRQADIEAAWVPPVRPDRLQAPGEDLILVGETWTEFEPEIIGCRPRIVDALAEAKGAELARLTALVQSVADYYRDFLASRRECGMDAAWEAVEDAAERVDVVVDQIRALRATTVQGFAVKAMPIYFWRFELWNLKPEDLDWDSRLTRELTDEMMSYLPEPPPSSSWR